MPEGIQRTADQQNCQLEKIYFFDDAIPPHVTAVLAVAMVTNRLTLNGIQVKDV